MTRLKNLQIRTPSGPFATPKTPSASGVVRLAIMPILANPPRTNPISHQSSTGKTGILSTKREWQSASSSMSKAPAMTHPLGILPTPALCAGTPLTEPPPAHATELSSILYILTTPYIAKGWCDALDDSVLTSRFPFLVNDISFGSPIGNPPPLHHTFIPGNLPSALSLPHIIDEEIHSEIAAKRLSGPFSISQVLIIFNGDLQTSPLGLIEKPPGSGKWHTIRHLSKEDEYSNLTNGWLNVEDFPMKYYSANMTADFVSLT